jgi:hypothetical protein
VVHKLIRKQRIVADDINLVAVSGVNYIIYSNVPVKQPAVCIDIVILMIEEKTAAALRVEVPNQNTETVFGKEASEVNRCGGFSNASFNIIYGNFFQTVKLISKSCL